MVVLLAVSVVPASAYSVLAHEATIDAAWDAGIRPLLLRRYPRTSDAALMEARSYAYGGSVIQDLGYYPFGNKFFSNLLHYVRAGDFVEALIRNAHDVNELAFALGGLAHYANDNTGHPLAVNLAVPLIFPKLGVKFGDIVTYTQAPTEHVIVEFSFDIVQAAGGAYLPQSYQSFIGFRVAKPLLARTFHDTYGFEMSDVFSDEDRAIATYRYAVSQVIPALTKAAWKDKHDEIVRTIPGLDRASFVFSYPRSSFERDYGRDYDKPGFFARMLGVIYRIVPKVGPLKPLSFKVPTPEAERLFVASFREATRQYRAALASISRGRLDLRNTNFDTGKPAGHGDYALADETYAELLERLTDDDFGSVPPLLRSDVLNFYGDRPIPSKGSKRDRKHWKEVDRALNLLKTAGPTAADTRD